MIERNAQPRSWFGQLASDTAYNLGGFLLGLPAFVLAVSLFSFGLSTAIIYIGVFILVGALLVARFFASAERQLTEWNSGALPPVYYRHANAHSRLRSVLGPLSDLQAWKDLIHAFVSFPVRVAAFSITLAWVAGALGGMTEWFWIRFIPGASTDVWDLLGIDPEFHWLLQFGAGLILLLTLPPLMKGLARIQRALTVGLLTNERRQLRERTEYLTNSRSSAVAAEAGTLRRIERDIHDGPQQRIVRMAMDLESAKRRLQPGDSETRELIEGAINQSREALAELRSLSRGIAPPVLVERGLPAALDAAAARCPVPVTLNTNGIGSGRFTPAAESAAYFAAVEALTNVAKHSNATECRLSARAEEGVLTVEVEDNGRGGAHVGKGTGLAGLQDRLAGVDGALEIDSPVDGGTTVRISIPVPVSQPV
ncbi:sensor histidine kinase [Arthrobacter tumbae]|uniref:sensor histidine kinase n=1 Tax=Arthrobacter tumbae TaxID=163874 RepID=UPI00195DCF74|nr:sensor domain-containing protein [Arthrobacter tumbae]MBM7780302.1 signal transduction histidine kinase [Arthrobacter tumbae]